MDVRHYFFLARQPSAALQNREHFWGMPKRGLAFLLANVMFWQPLWAQADGIVVATPGTSLGQAGNGVPIVNIATPNGAGLSHNQFHDYNVGTQGVILNNGASQTSPTQLGGIIIGNPHLKNSGSAQAILNEVVGGSPSQLRGYTEVAGQSARVIVANPYGISCNGCGFINTPRVTLTTGKPVLDGAGRLDRFQVDQGSVSIDGAGLNATNVDRFEIITRSARINAEIQAKNLTIVTGRNDVNAESLNATARADDGGVKPQLAIDSSALGGMYAGAIRLVGTEAGVGVKLAGNVAASGGDIQIDANGHLTLAQTSATGAVNVKAATLEAQGPVYAGTAVNVQIQGNLTNQQTLAARDSIVLSAGGQLSNSGVIEAGVNADNSRNAGGDVSLSAQSLNNAGKTVIASRNLTVNTSQILNNQNGTLSAAQTANIIAGLLDNRSGQVLGDLGLDIDLSGALDNRDGVLGSGKRVDLKAASLDNSGAGVVVSDGTLTTRISGLLDNRGKGNISAKGAVEVRSGSLDNRDGKVISRETLVVISDTADNRAGVIQADKQLKLQIDRMDNRDKGLISGKSGIAFDGTRLDNSGGLLSAAGPVALNASEVQNAAGRISSQSDFTAVIGLLQQQGGALVAQGNLNLTGTTVDNRNGGLIGTTQALTLNVGDVDNRAGEISSGLLLSIGSQRLDNSEGGKVLSGSDLQLAVANLINQSKGLVHAKGIAALTGVTLDNRGGSLVTQQSLDIRLDNALSNVQGLISSEGTLTVNAGSLNSSRGSLSSAGALVLTTTGALNNQSGSISTDSRLTLKSQSLNNSQNGQISGKQATAVTTGTFDNTQGGQLISGDSLDLTAKQVSNGLASLIASDKALTASVTGLDQQGGQLFSKTSLSLDLNQGRLNNRNGLINAPLLMLKNLKDISNLGGEISSAQAFTLLASNLDNSNGKLISNQSLTLRIDQLLSSVKGLVSAQSLDVQSAHLDNSGGLISSRGALAVTVDGQLVNHDGTFIADGDVNISADSLDNTLGQIAGKTDVTANVAALNNQGGQLIATGGIALTGISLDNRFGGLIGSTNALQLDIGSVDNRGGELSSKSDVILAGKQLDNSDGGRVFAQGALAMTVDQVLNRARGLLSGKAGLTLTGRDLDNSGGSLLSQKDLKNDLSGDLHNSQGLLSAEGTLDVTAASLINTLGSLSAAGPLTLTTTGGVFNQGGEIVTDAGLTLKGASVDNSNKGSISGRGAVRVDTGSLDNSHNGRLNSGGTLDLTATQMNNQEGGRVASSGALTANVTGLNQQGGQLFSNMSLTLDLNQGQLNNRNGLISAPLLMLKNLGDINNDGGEISSAQAFDVAARSLDNRNGKLLSNQALSLRVDQALTNTRGLIAAAALEVKAASLDNSGGTLTSRAYLDLDLDGLLNNQNLGLINATTGLTVNSSGLNNQNGSLLGTAIAIDFGAATGDLNNSNGLITTAGVLSIQHLRDLANRYGEISSSQSVELDARAIDNTGGKLISNDVLTVNADTVLNLGGLLSGWRGLSLTGNSLDNRNKGTLSSRDGDVAVAVSGDVLNSGEGALVSQKNLRVNAANLDNSNGGVLSSAGAQTLTLSGSLSNSQGGLVDSGATLVMQAMTLGNAGGTVNASQALSFTGATLDNTGGNMVGNAAVTLDLLGVLTNTNGKLASAGPLLVQRSTHINNQGGQLASQGLMTLLTSGLDNRNRGTVAANDLLTITASGAVQNSADGLIYSQNGDLKVQAASLANAKGTLQSQGALILTTSGDVDNQSGRIIAKAGDLSINAGSLDNRGGVLASLQAAFSAQLIGVLKNGYDLNNNRQAGVTQAQRLNLTALGGIDNYGGRISAQSGDAIISTGNFDNRNGGLYAKGKINVTGNHFDNSGDNGGQIAGSQIDLNLTGALNNRRGVIESDSTLAIKAASLDNQTGQLRALGLSGKTDLRIGGLFDNRNGALESANTDLDLAVGSFLNGGGSLLHVGNGTFDISTANVTGAGGSIITRGGLTLNADSWSNGNVIQAGRLNVNVNNFSQTASGQLLASTSLVGTGGNWYNDGLIASDGSLKLTLGGNYSGNGRLSSQGNMDLSASQIDLASSSRISGGAKSTLSASILNNYGRLSSVGDLDVTAANLNNFGTLGGSENVRLKAAALLNQNGLIFSGQDMALRVNTFTNRFADVYSLRNISLAKDDQNGRSLSFSNISATMESAQDMTLNVDHIENRKDVFEAVGGLVSSNIGVRCFDCDVAPELGDRPPASHLVWEQNYKSVVTKDSVSASLTAGRDLLINGADLLNKMSTITAGRDMSLNLGSFQNEGASVGEYSVRRSLETPGYYWDQIMAFNAVNDPDYNNTEPGAHRPDGSYIPHLHFWNKDYRETLVAPKTRAGGREAARFTWFGSIRVEIGGGDDVFHFALSSFQPGIQVDAPAPVKNSQFFDEVITYKSPSSYANAVVQAGGKVTINATQSLTNGVVREGVALNPNGSRLGSTQTNGNTPTIININQQLPPNLAQQQVNPVALPGFSLPVGQNGLFRLSGQGSSTPANSGPQSWSMGNASISLSQREQTSPIGQARDIHLDNAPLASASAVGLSLADRQAANMSAGASLIDVATPGSESSNTALPRRSSVFTVDRVLGVPASSGQSKPHKYLIETNPVLTDLKSFMSSDYLLSNLGYDPDLNIKRLGDGLYEQRLIQQAVVARTGQRYIDGQTTDEGLFKYLMNNAIASKQALNLSMGVSLTAEQVAALTHDIVWMESVVVNGEQVLVPILYLANANNRLAPNGALIQGTDVNLIAGKDLDNSGTLRASNNLSVNAGNDLVNSGLVEAGNRLDLLAGNNLVNKAGGIIAGRDVSLTAARGDVINERTVTSGDSRLGDNHNHTDVLDSAARIEAANSLALKAGRDIDNSGGVLESGADTTINAGRDVNLVSAEQVISVQHGRRGEQTITQYGSIVDVGQSLTVNAGRDIVAIASQIDAKRDVSMSAVGNLTLASAADEQHSYGKSKRVTSQEDHVSQVSTSVTAGGAVSLNAGKDLNLIASRVSAGDEAYLFAGDNLTLQSAEDTDYSFYSKTKKSSSGKKSRLDETSSTTNIASAVTSGGDSTLVAGNDMLIKGSEIAAEKGGVQLVAGNDLRVVAVTDSNSARHESSSSKSSWGGLKSSKVENKVSETQTAAVGSMISGNTVDVVANRDITITGSSLVSTRDLAVQAGRDLSINAAENTFTRNELHKEKNRDLSGVLTANNLGVDDITGNQHLSVSSQNHTGKSSQTTLTGSTIGSSEGNVSLTSGRELSVTASDLVSTKNMSLVGSKVTIAAGIESASQSSTDKSSSLAVGRVIGGMVVDTVNTIRNSVRAANSADDPRLKAVKLAQAAMAFNDLGGMGGDTEGAGSDFGKEQGTASNGSLIKIGTELANTHSKSTSEYTSQIAKQSMINAGNRLLIIADGGAPGAAGDIHVVGSSLRAADTVLLAKNNIILESAQNTANWANNNSNNKTAIGASFNLGAQNGFTLDLGASIAKSMGTSSSVTQVNTTLDTGALFLHSGQDTTLAGALVRADSIKALIDGNLNIASRQDSETQKSKQGSAGIGGSICIPPFCYGAPVTVSASLAAGNMNSDYKAVTEQSGLFAGEYGYNITVGQNTTLQGAVIASEASADKNLLSTDRLIVSDIKNTSEISAQSAAFTASYGSNAGSSVGGSIPLSLEDSDRSSTRSAVSEGTVTVRSAQGTDDLTGLNRDTANANQALDKPDEKAIQERIDLVQSSVELAKNIINKVANAQQQGAGERISSATTQEERQAAIVDYNSWAVGGDKRIMADVAAGLIAVGLGGVGGTTAIGVVANTTSNDTFRKIGDYADKQQRTATDYATRTAWAEGGPARIMLHALAGAVMGLSNGSVVSGALGAGASAAIMPGVADALRESGLTEAQQTELNTLIASGLGAMAGSGATSSAIAAANGAAGVERFNRQLHKTQEIPLLKKKAEDLEKTVGRPESSARWEDLLLLASGAEVDAIDSARLTGLMKQLIGNDPESAAFNRDLGVAYETVAQLSAQKIPLTWSDGRQIVANGAPVYAFNATKEQFNDATLFNAAGTYGPGAVYQHWSQFGKAQTSQYSNELANTATYASGVQDAAERLSTLADKGILSVTAIDDAILSLAGVRVGKVVVDAVMEVLAKRRAAKELAAGAGAKGISEGLVVTNKPLGLGSTGRTVANNLSEQLAMKEAMSNPASGSVVPMRNGMTDARWPGSDGWVKMRQNVNGVEVHYVRNTNSGAVDDFKFK